MATQAENVYMAKLAEQAERYDEMVEYMKELVNSATEDLSLEQRNLLSVAYKNVVGARRASLRIIGSIEQKEKEKGNGNAEGVTQYKTKVEDELNRICNDILSLLGDKLIPKAKAEADKAEASVFYQKMKADYYRYLAEFAKDPQKKEHADCAQEAYQAATKEAGRLKHPYRALCLRLDTIICPVSLSASMNR